VPGPPFLDVGGPCRHEQAPERGTDHKQVTDRRDGAGNVLVLRQQSHAPEQVVPIVLPAPDERQLLRACVRDVHCDVAAVLPDPPQGDARRVLIALPQELDHEERRHEELEQRAAGKADELPEWRENEMSRFVDGEVDAIE
jgi:hypothetical protein